MKDDKKKEKETQANVVEEQAEEATVDEESTKESKEIEELKEQAEVAENKYRRALADYQNLQKRVQEEKRDWIRAANSELLLRLLPVLDTLILANQHVQDEGLKVSVQQFLDTLKAEGVTKLETVGEEFNPHLMECITTEPGEENKVLEELRAGYMLNEKVLRPAQVKVGRK
jgi:molecular chaperone GrpE